MKKIISIFFIFSFFILVTKEIVAQQSNLMLALTPYQTRENLDILFSQSTQVLEYLSGEDVEEPLFLSLITANQKRELESNGFIPRIIDENTDISRYILLFHPLPNQSFKLNEYGEVIIVSQHYALVKASPEKPFTHTGLATEFFDIPFLEAIATPPLRTKTSVSPFTTPVPLLSPTSTPPQNNNSLPLLILTLIAVFGVAGVGLTVYFIHQKRLSKNSQTPPGMPQNG